MRILLTSSRMPCAIDLIRKLGSQGHTVIATDTFRATPGGHSKYAAALKITASPRYETRRFIQDIKQIMRDERIDLVVPAFEEVFYLAKHVDELAPIAPLFMPSFETLATLHDKAATMRLAIKLGIRVPRTIIVTSREELRSGAADIPEFFARPVYSRGGVELFTNTGPLAGVISLDDCVIEKEKPWLLQEFVHGTDVCSMSIAHSGRISGHAAYIHPREIEHAGGIVFESVHEPECLEIAKKIVEETRYNGHVSFDFMKTDRGMVLIECNPRPTAGAHVMSPEIYEQAVLDWEASKLRIAEPGIRCKYSVALVRDMVLHWKEAPEDIKHLFSDAKEMIADPEDLLPALYQILSYGHVLNYRFHLHTGAHQPNMLMAAYFHDICWNGEPIE